MLFDLWRDFSHGAAGKDELVCPIPIPASSHHPQTFFPLATFKPGLVDGEEELAVENLFQVFRDVLDFLAEFDITDQLAIDSPGMHHTQRECTEGAKFDSVGRFVLLGSLAQRETFDEVSVAWRIVDTQETHPIQAEEIEMCNPVLGTYFLEDRPGDL